MSGWIKVDRRITKNPLWTDAEPFDKRSAWIDLLLMANHSDHEVFHRGKYITVKRGEVNRSILQLSERWRWSRNKCNRFLRALEHAGMVTTKSTTDGTTIFIINYTKYQYSRATNDTTDDTTDDTTGGTYTRMNNNNIKNNQERKRYINQAELSGMSVMDYIRKKSKGEIQ